MDTNTIDLGKSFDKLKKELKPTAYGMKRIAIGILVLTRDDKPIMPIPEEFAEDFVEILSRAATYDKLFKSEISD